MFLTWLGSFILPRNGFGVKYGASVSSNILSNADTILSQKVANIETVCKMLDTQGDVVRKMLKESIEGDSKEIQNL